MDSFGAFTQCMVDGDPESLRRERKNPRFGLAVSVTFQVALLATLVLIPLMSQAVLPLVRVNQIPLLQAPPTVPIVQAQVAHPTTDRLPSIPTHFTPVVHRPSTAFTAIGIDPGPVELGSIGDPTNILGTAGALPQPPEMPSTSHQPDRPITRGGNVMEAMLTNRIQPTYPSVAKLARASGAVVLNAIIGTDGTIQSLKVISGNPLLIKAATDAVSQWRYKPTLLNGQPVEVETLITVNFVLQE
jgi:protein TonB